jgi:L-amino acid N-acyltransferase YncA
MLEFSVRAAVLTDAAAIAAIYAPHVEKGVVSFEVQVPSASEMATRIQEITTMFPWLVAERASEILGYAYASKHRERPAYQWSADVTVYVAAAAQRQGVGRQLYGQLLAILRRQGFRMAYAGITLPNPASVGLHEAMGFTPLGVFRNVGF